jgi:hypothetical protein
VELRVKHATSWEISATQCGIPDISFLALESLRLPLCLCPLHCHQQHRLCSKMSPNFIFIRQGLRSVGLRRLHWRNRSMINHASARLKDVLCPPSTRGSPNADRPINDDIPNRSVTGISRNRTTKVHPGLASTPIRGLAFRRFSGIVVTNKKNSS